MVVQILKTIIAKVRGLFFDKNNPKSAYWITVFISLIIVVGGINLFVELTAKVKNELVGGVDQQVTDYVLSFRNPKLTDYFVFVTNIGDVKGYIIVLILTILISFFILKKWKFIGQIFLVLVLATLSNMMLKRFIDRARPEIEHLVSVKTLSYPSGHAMSSMAFYGFLIYLVYKLKVRSVWKVFIILLLSLLILSIGISRIYLGVHFPSDVIGGWVAGMIWIVFCILIFNLVEVFRRDPKT
ncbi:phosphatase PAP2 family protein [Pareuzebyella sediminis]|uniref:phosphatase PAP2 family protein n=1 Tax=Pareuzebyella sediminis TaxID=2607998 RepID=UPI0011F072D4|nr:phosphatase PAP2 family protein [Pareuzebyella sediminis]